MKTVLGFAALLLLTGVARADWKDLKPGMDQQTAWKCAGTPMLLNKARGSEVWTYDHRGYIMFEGGRVTYWEQPKTAKPELSAFARAQAKALTNTATAMAKSPPVAKHAIAIQD